MDSEKWKEVKELLHRALALAPDERAAFLDGLETEMRVELESLLDGEALSDDAMRVPAVEFSKDFFDADDLQGSFVGRELGSYKIIGELGSGGMGAVYLAERAAGKFRQKAALKLLRREMNTAAFRSRFDREREILASLEHPNIARFLDAGSSDDGVPFLALEFVDGVPIDDFCEARGLGLQERLDLFRLVCGAVDFAHRNLIVHRDLKPSNILVDAEGVPKLLDFGISKIIAAEFADHPTATVTRLGAMTPAYSSPEQLEGKSVTTATDVYSLGVILFQLLSGHRPFESEESDFNNFRRAVNENEPPPPSSFASRSRGAIETGRGAAADGRRTARQSGATSPKGGVGPALLTGDLDNIVVKALSKEPERRYSSARELAEDIARHQRGLPVTARPNTFRYRAGKFVRRNRSAVTAAAVVILAVVSGIAATLWQARAARTERARAERRFNDVRKLANSNLFDVYPEIENLEGSLKAREKILVNALAYLDSLAGESGGDAELQSELATAYEKVGDVQGALNNSSLGKIEAGLESYAKARRLRESVFAADPANPETKEKLANNYYVTARTLWNNSQAAAAEEMFENGLKLRRELVAQQPGSNEARNRLAVLLIDYGAIPVFNSQTPRAVVLFEEAFRIVEALRAAEPANPDYKKTSTRLLRVMSKAKGSLGDYEGAERGFRQAIAVSAELAAEFPADFRVQRSVWLTNSLFCEMFIDKGDPKAAVDTCAPTIGFPKAALDKEPANGVVAYDLAISYFNTARADRLAGKFAETIANAEQATAVMNGMIAKSPANLEYKRNLAIYQTEMARAQIKLRQFERADAALQNVLRIMLAVTAADDEATYRYDLAMAHRLSAEVAYETGRFDLAAERIGEAVRIVGRLAEEGALRDTDRELPTELAAEQRRYGERRR